MTTCLIWLSFNVVFFFDGHIKQVWLYLSVNVCYKLDMHGTQSNFNNRSFVFCALKEILNYLAFRSVDFECTWWLLFQKRFISTKLIIYGFFFIMEQIMPFELFWYWRYCSGCYTSCQYIFHYANMWNKMAFYIYFSKNLKRKENQREPVLMNDITIFLQLWLMALDWRSQRWKMPSWREVR